MVATRALIVAFASEINETALLADIILPEPTFAERWDLLSDAPIFPRAHVSLQQPVIAPLYGAKQSEEVLATIANALSPSFGVKFKSTSPESMVKAAAAALKADSRGGTCRVGPDGEEIQRTTSSRTFWKHLRETALWATEASYNAPSLPAQRAVVVPRKALALSGPGGPKALRDRLIPVTKGDPHVYPYYLATFRVPELRNGELTNFPIMMELCGHWGSAIRDTWAEMHPRTAAEAGVKEGSRIRVVSDLGQIEAVAHVTQAVPPSIIAVPLGLGHETGSTASGVGSNPNRIVESSVTEGPSLARTAVTRVKIEAA